MSKKPYFGACTDRCIRWEHEGGSYILKIDVDEDPSNPREDENLAVMRCFHNRYRLGDETDKRQDADEMWRDLVAQHVPSSEILDAALNGKLTGFRVVESATDKGHYDIYETYYLAGYQTSDETRETLEYESIEKGSVVDYLFDDLTIGNCQALLHPYIEWMPLWLYDHSGLTISCGTRSGQYADRWDSGQVGWIYLSRERMEKEGVTCYVLDENGERVYEECSCNDALIESAKIESLNDQNWRGRAQEIMEGEVELYDWYLRGDVYGYTLYEANTDEAGDIEIDDLEEIDSCWGFYGDNLFENGMLSCIGYGLSEALKNGKYETGIRRTYLRTYEYIDF